MSATVKPATPKQVEFLTKLTSEREHSESVPKPESLSVKEASSLISLFLTKPKVQRPVQEVLPVSETKNTPVIEVTEPLIEGFYTVVFEDGEYRTLRLRRQKAGSTFMPGRMMVSYLCGPDNTSDYNSFAHVNDEGNVIVWRRYKQDSVLAEAVRVLVGDPKAAQMAYAQKSGNCYICGRTLTTPESIAKGLGPVCEGR